MNNNMGYNNKAWGRTNNSSNLMNQNQLQSQQPGGLGNMVPFPGNQQIFQNPLGLQQQNLGLGLQQINNAMTAAAALSSQVASNPIFQQVSYPNSRGLNPKAFQSNLPLQNSQNNGSGRQRVFTGKVTQMHDNFGLVDEEVVFQMNVCVMGSRPTVGDRVLVEAQNTPNMPFKWNATRIQVITGRTLGYPEMHERSREAQHSPLLMLRAAQQACKEARSPNSGIYGAITRCPEIYQGRQSRFSAPLGGWVRLGTTNFRVLAKNNEKSKSANFVMKFGMWGYNNIWNNLLK